ncbi:MAG: hypothetical protein VB141_10935 [Burkholderia gladioli]
MATVSVGCKLPHGLIIQIPGSKPIRLNGANSSILAHGHGVTDGVDKSFFEKWKELYKDFLPLKQGLIFSHDRADAVAAEASEKVKNRTGFEGLNADNPAPGIVAENYDGMPKKAA